MKHFAKKNYDFTFFSQLCKDVYLKMGTYYLERVPENAKTGTYHLEHVPENAKMGTYHSNERRARTFKKSNAAKEKINKTKQSSHQMRKTK